MRRSVDSGVTLTLIIVVLLLLALFVIMGIIMTGNIAIADTSPSLTASPSETHQQVWDGDSQWQWGYPYYYLETANTKLNIGSAEVRLADYTGGPVDYLLRVYVVSGSPKDVWLQQWTGKGWKYVGRRTLFSVSAGQSTPFFFLGWRQPEASTDTAFYLRAIARDRRARPEAQLYWNGPPTGHNSPDSTQTPAWELKIMVK